MSKADRRLRVCIAGYGRRGEEQFQALENRRDVWEVVGIADRSPVAYVRLQVRYYDRRIPVVPNVADLAEFEPDAILVSTTAAAHVPVTLELLDAGYEGAVLIEKPVSSSVAAARRLADAVTGWRGQAAVDFQRRCSRMYAEVAALLASGDLGAVESIRYTPTMPTKISMDGSHYVDLANWLVGAAPCEVSATLGGDSITDRRGAVYFDPEGTIDVLYDNGAAFCLDALRSADYEGAGLSIVCERGKVTVRTEQEVVISGPKGVRRIPADAEPGLTNPTWFEQTLRALTAGANGLRPCTVDEAVRDLETVVAAFLSNHRGEPVVLPLSPAEAELEIRVA